MPHPLFRNSGYAIDHEKTVQGAMLPTSPEYFQPKNLTGKPIIYNPFQLARHNLLERNIMTIYYEQLLSVTDTTSQLHDFLPTKFHELIIET